MAWTAKRCVPVHSSWVFQLIQGCNGEFAIQFLKYVHRRHGIVVGGVPGVTCYYPFAPAGYFDLALTWPSKGHFVHRFLYKVQPYKIIANPCPAGDCETAGCDQCVAAPLQWKATLAGVTSGTCNDCDNLNRTHVLDYVDTCHWHKDILFCNGVQTMDLFYDATTSTWALSFGPTFSGWQALYTHPTAGFQCLGANVMTGVNLTDGDCGNMPATITVSPA
jgi:hypothetical protein